MAYHQRPAVIKTTVNPHWQPVTSIRGLLLKKQQWTNDGNQWHTTKGLSLVPQQTVLNRHWQQMTSTKVNRHRKPMAKHQRPVAQQTTVITDIGTQWLAPEEWHPRNESERHGKPMAHHQRPVAQQITVNRHWQLAPEACRSRNESEPILATSDMPPKASCLRNDSESTLATSEIAPEECCSRHDSEPASNNYWQTTKGLLPRKDSYSKLANKGNTHLYSWLERSN